MHSRPNHSRISFRLVRFQQVAMLITVTIAGSIAATAGAQQFQEPEIGSAAEPAAVSVPHQHADEVPEHSILINARANQGDRSAQPRTSKASGIPETRTSQLVPQNPPAQQNASSTIQRLPGDGTEAKGTFATSNQMPIVNPNMATNNYGAIERKSVQSAQPASQPPALAPLRTNGLQGANANEPTSKSLIPKANPMTGNSLMPNTTRTLADQPGFDRQPVPPSPSGGFEAPSTRRDIGGANQTLRAKIQGSFPKNSFPDMNRGANLQSQPVTQPTRSETFPNKALLQTQGMGQPASQIPVFDKSNQPQQDSMVRPARFEQNSARGISNTRTTGVRANGAPEQKSNLRLARKLIEKYHVDNAPDPLPGKPVKLVTLIEKTPVSQRRELVHQFWTTYFDWSNYLNATQQIAWLYKVPRPIDPNELALLNAAQAAARNAALAAEIQLGKSQSRLRQLMPGQTDDLLPLPHDTPLVQAYQTHYDWFNKRGRIPQRLKGIDIILPKTIDLISYRAATVGTTRDALKKVRAAYAANPRSVASLLEAVRLWNHAEQDLVASVVNYNQAIADYSLTLVQGSKTPKQIVAMLTSPLKPRVATSSNSRTFPGNRRATQTMPATRMQPQTRQTLQRQQTAGMQPNQRQGFNPQSGPRIQNASQRSLPGGDAISRTMRRDNPANKNFDLNPGGFERNPNIGRSQPSTTPGVSGSRQLNGGPSAPPTRNPAVKSNNDFGTPRLPSSQPSYSQPSTQSPPADRSARRGTEFGGTP